MAPASGRSSLAPGERRVGGCDGTHTVTGRRDVTGHARAATQVGRGRPQRAAPPGQASRTGTLARPRGRRAGRVMRPSPFRPGRAGDPPPPQSFWGAAPHSWAGCPPSCVSRHCPLRKREPVYAAGLLTGGSGEGGRSVLTNGLTGTVTSGKHMLKRVTGRRGHREPSTQSGNLSPTSPRGRPPARRLREEAARRGAFRSRGDNGARVPRAGRQARGRHSRPRHARPPRPTRAGQ